MQASGVYIIYTNRKPLQPTNKPIISRTERACQVYLKSYAKSKENRGFQLVKYGKGHISDQEQQDGRTGRQAKRERKKEAKKENRTMIVL